MRRLYSSILLVTLIFAACDTNSQKEITIIPDPAKGQDAIISSLEHSKNFFNEENNHLYAAINGENTNIT